VAVSDVGSVAGKWSGLMELEGGGDREDFVEMTIERDGAYRASGARTIGLMDGKGKVVVADGKLRLDGDKGARATGTLYERSPERSLVVVGALPSGRRFSVRLKPAP
jgi:hypothetical protein